MGEKLEAKLIDGTVILGLIISVLSVIFTAFILAYCGYPPGGGLSVYLGYGAVYFIILLILVAIGWVIKPLRLRPDQYGLIYAMILVSTGMGITPAYLFGMSIQSVWPGYEGQSWMQEMLAPLPAWTKELPWMFVTDKVYLDPWVFTGGGTVPWGAWIMPIAFWLATLVSMAIMFNGIVLILHKQWIDVEKLPFPYSIPAVEIARLTSASSKMLTPRKKIFLIGMVIGVFTEIGELLRAFVPGQGWTWLSLLYGHFINVTNVLPNSGDVNLMIWPVWIAVYYLAPMTITLTAWVTSVFFHFVVPPVEVWLGVTPDYGQTLGYGGMSQYGAIKPIPIQLGGIVSLGAFVLFTQREHVMNALKIAFGRFEAVSVEKKDYTVGWMMAIVGFIVLLALYAAAGAGAFAIVGVVVYFLFWFYRARIRSYTYTYPGQWHWPGNMGSYLGYAAFQHIPSQAQRFGAELYGEALAWGYYFWDPLGSTFEGVRIGATLGIPYRKVIYACIIATIAAVLVGTPLVLHLIYAVGLSGGFGRVWWAWDLPNAAGWIATLEAFNSANTGWNRGAAPADPTAPGVAANFVLGIAIVGFLTFARIRWLWFPLDPVGFLLGLFQTMHWQTWFYFFAWLFQIITFKVGGSKLYAEKGVPLFAGIVIGASLSSFLSQVFWPITGYLLYYHVFPAGG